jgi:ribose 5-phosphate isomerase B
MVSGNESGEQLGRDQDCASQTRLALGSDHNGLALKTALCEHLIHAGYRCDDFGTYEDSATDYPDIALRVAQSIASGVYDRGILICGTGIGMAVVANKVPGVIAAQISDVYQAERARKSNDAQIVTLGAATTGVELGKMLVDAWLRSEFEGGRSGPKVKKIRLIDSHFRRVQSSALDQSE